MASLARLLVPVAVFLLALAQSTKAASDEAVAGAETPQNRLHEKANDTSKKEPQPEPELHATLNEGAEQVQRTGVVTKAVDASEDLREQATQLQSILPGKVDEVKKILANPPRTFHLMFKALPFSFYGKDKYSNYVALCNLSSVNWKVVDSVDPQEISVYIRYVALFFWMYVDKRPDSSLSLVVDTKDISLMRVLDGSAKAMLSALISGLNDTIQYVGKRPGRVFVVNAPVFLCPVINMTAKLAHSDVEFLALSKKEQWEPVLKDFIGLENLPVEYGGTNPVQAHKSRILLLLKNYVKRQVERQVARSTTKRRQ